MQIINELANIIIFINATLFYIFVFGREVKALARLNIVERWLLRVGLAIPSMGALYNVLVGQYPPIPEIIINVGYASLFTWASIFHYKTFVRNGK
jgi:hypothetical protein